MLYFCTLFDSNYLSRGLTMYKSLAEHCPSFHLYIFPFDERTSRVLKRLSLPHVTLVPLSEFESEDLLRVKPTRTRAEYCWTSTSSAILHVLEQYHVDLCTYVDADLFFYDNPSILIDEMQGKSVMITEHRYNPRYDLSAWSGIYCVQFISFRNDERGMKALRWWRDRCIEWCYDREEDGKFGDQKYLDDWPGRFQGVQVLRHRGGGVAGWNVQLVRAQNANGNIRCTNSSTGTEFSMVFYHFHFVRFYTNGLIDLGDYSISQNARDVFYKPYLRQLEKSKERIRSVDDTFDPHGPREFPRSWEGFINRMKRRARGRYSVYPFKELL